jgi:hypothetical protein
VVAPCGQQSSNLLELDSHFFNEKYFNFIENICNLQRRGSDIKGRDA